MTAHTPPHAGSQPDAPPTAMRRRPAAVRVVLVATLAFGVLLHSIALVMGRAWLLEKVLTPSVDVALLVPMAFSAWGLWSLRKAAVHPGGAHRAVYMIVCAYMAVSALVHLETLAVWEVRYMARFPHWYSAFIIPLQVAMLIFAARLRFGPPEAR